MIDKLPKSASMEVASLARKLKSEGVDVISLSIGDTHFKLPQPVQKRIMEAMENNRTHYSSAQGEAELLDAIAQSYQNIYTPKDIIITHGVKNGIYSYLLATDKSTVCAIEPAWLGYEGLCILSGKNYIGLNRHINNYLENLENTDFDILILCSPNNPDGTIFSEAELDQIYCIARSKGAEVLIDEIYRHYHYNQNSQGCSRLHGCDGVILFDGFSKAYAATGLRVGYIATRDHALKNAIIKVQQNTITCVNTISQYGLSIFNMLDETILEFRDYYRTNKDAVTQTIPGMASFKPDGGFYYFFDLKSFNIESNAQKFCKGLLEKEAVALIPGGAYGTGFDSYVRLSFCVDHEQLKEGLTRLNRYIDTCKK